MITYIDIAQRLNQVWRAFPDKDVRFVLVHVDEWDRCTQLTREAAKEIERLRKELTERIHLCDMRSEKILELTAERDEARRWICEEIAHQHETVWNDGERDFPPLLAVDVAISNGWDCFKEDGK